MLKADLGLLQRQRRLELEEMIPADDPMWQDAGVTLQGPLDVRLDVQQAGPDVAVLGRIQGTAALACRRCVVPVTVPLDETVTWLFRDGISAVEAEAEEVYALPAKSRELDLRPAVREQVMLAVPEFVSCSEACRGLCPRCGANRNEVDCGCEEPEIDSRWAALRRRSD